MFKFKIGDKIKVNSGKDKGREATIEKIFFKTQKAVVAGINIYKKHVKGMPGRKGGIYDIPRPIALAKLSVVCPNCNKITRVGFKFVGTKKVRLCKSCNREIDLNSRKNK